MAMYIKLLASQVFKGCASGIIILTLSSSYGPLLTINTVALFCTLYRFNNGMFASQAFEWLGYWYQGVGGDSDRARGCFSRAVKLDPENGGAGEALALLYLQTGQAGQLFCSYQVPVE